MYLIFVLPPFDQYQIYRPKEILNNLSNMTDFTWQKSIWEKLSENKIDRSTGFDKFLHIKNSNYLSNLQRISIIGIFSMPPMFVEFFQHLAKFINVNLYLLSPIDFIQKNVIFSGTFHNLKSENNIKINPIIDSLGNAGNDFFQLLKFANSFFHPTFTKKINLSLLANFQNSLQKENIESNQLIPEEKISSIQIHNCHSKMREVEILKNNILYLIDNDNIKISEITVMMPNIADYSPYIKSIFNKNDISSNHEVQNIPFTITDNSITFSSPIDDIFLQLLQIHKTQFESTFVLDLLEKEVIYKNLKLTEADINLCRKWISETKICWGINGKQRQDEFGLINFDENSWEKGFNRMFLGFCTKDDEFPKLHYNHLPYEQFEGHNNLILGKLSHFISLLENLYKTFKNPTTIDKWKEILYQLIEDFFHDYDEFQKDLILLREKITQLEKITTLVDITDNVSIEIIHHYFKENLNDEFQTNRYFRGGITFSTIQPLRNIPAKVICLLGMNDNEFPRNEHYNSFNILGKERRIGDRVKREEDQYLFLETIVSAQKYLLISYIGQNIRTNDVSEPSSSVCELMDYLKTQYGEKILNKIYFQHKLQSHNPIYFDNQISKYFSYSSHDFQSQVKKRLQKFYTDPMTSDIEIEEINIEDLIKTLSNSSQFFTEQILGAKIKNWTIDVKDAEAFELDNLEKYKINQFIQEQIIKESTPEFIYSILKAKDMLPVSFIGKQEFENLYNDMKKYLDQPLNILNNLSAKEFLSSNKSRSIDFEFNNIQFYGNIPSGNNYQILYSRYASFNGKDALRSWIYHIFNSITSNNSITICFTKKNEIKLFPELNINDAKVYLANIIELYRQSFKQPLLFFPNSSFEYMKSKNKIYQAKQKWNGSYKFSGENEDPYYQLYFQEKDLDSIEFIEIAKNLLSPFGKHFENDKDQYKVEEVKE